MITKSIIAGTPSGLGKDKIQSTNPKTKQLIKEEFIIATSDEINKTAELASKAWLKYKLVSGAKKGEFLRQIATNIEELGDTLVQKMIEESGLPEVRVKGERGRTCNQLKMFAGLVEEGHWVDATIDEALPDRKPMPRSDIRNMLQAVGPVVIFGASNFPLAFSTAGGDTASALASGCPVIVKSHPSHLGTHSLVSEAITNAVDTCGLPKGVFSSIIGNIDAGQQLVQHPLIKAVGFTGSLRGGTAIMKLAQERDEPIPVYAEMGSVNPIFLYNQKLKNSNLELSKVIANSINMGAGQFCTNPGLIVLKAGSEGDKFIENLGNSFNELKAFTMLNEGIYNHYVEGKNACLNNDTVNVGNDNHIEGEWKAGPAFGVVEANDFIDNKHLQKEIFGPFTLVIKCKSEAQFEDIINDIEGQLTATVFGEEEEIASNINFIHAVSNKVGRIVFNGVPTGVEVGYAMHHGGPYPAASNGMFTSVGTKAIVRFARPVVYQDAPNSILPLELKHENPLKIRRVINGQMVL